MKLSMSLYEPTNNNYCWKRILIEENYITHVLRDKGTPFVIRFNEMILNKSLVAEMESELQA